MTKARQNATAIERGSNSNGEWVRYPDGTQICWKPLHEITESTDNAVDYGYNLQSRPIWTFPKAFMDNNIDVRVTAERGSGRLVYGLAVSKTTADMDYQIVNGRSETDVVFGVSFYAIGRWK